MLYGIYKTDREISLFYLSKSVGSYSIYCKSYNYWVHKKCSNLKGRLRDTYRCRKCTGEIGVHDGPQVEHVMVDGAALKVDYKFCYLGNMITVLVVVLKRV